MKTNKPIIITIVVGILVLLFFPSPETNFPAYVGTALVFVIIIFLLIRSNKKKKVLSNIKKHKK